MEPVGTELRSAREKKKVLLTQIAQATRINLNYLKNLEEGRYSDMPGGMYNRAFLRAYCEHLGLDPKEYLERYESETAPPSEKVGKSKMGVPPPRQFSLNPHPLLSWGLMLLVSVVGLYFSRNWISTVFSPYFSRSPVRMPSSSVAEIQPVPSNPGDSAHDSQSQGSSVSPSPLPASASTNQTAIPVASQQPTASESTRNSQLPPPPPGTIRIEFTVIQKCWVSVDSDGTRALVKLLEAGENQVFDATSRFYIILGNAGGVRLKINGRPAKPLGKFGEVVKVLINQQNLSEMLERTNG